MSSYKNMGPHEAYLNLHTHQFACLLCCRYGIAIFDIAEEQPEFNPNVTYELGMMHLLQRECLIFKSSLIKTMPTDILQKIYVPFSSPDEAADKVDVWLRALSR